MAMNTKESFSLKGSKVQSLLGEIQQVQKMSAGDCYTKLMLADTTDALVAAAAQVSAAVAAAQTEQEALAAVNAKYDVEGYRMTPEQIPASATVQQIRAIRSFIKVD